MEETILTANALKFRYDPEQPVYALNGVSVGVQRGEFVAVLGANGCGKSTLAKHFNAILLPESGTVLVEGMDMPIRVVRSEQTCALGAAMFAAVAAGVYKDINEATRHMGSDIEAEYRPDEKRALIYEKLYKKYLELAKLAETIN